MTPRFSVVIPTRERAETLRHCLATCLEQDYDDYEIVVCDNFSSPATRQAVDNVDSDKVRYLRTDRPLAMSANWELAVSEARGEFVTVLGDDDGLMPYALRELAALISQHDSAAALHWVRGIYTWPNIGVPEEANYLRVPLRRDLREVDGVAMAAAVLTFGVNVDALPMIYNSVIHRDLIADVRARVGRLFPTIYPDLYSGFALAFAAGTYLSLDVPMNLAGLSGSSNGVATLMRKEGDPIAAEFASLNDDFEFRPHPRVPNLPLPAAAVVDSFEYARDNLQVEDSRLTYDRRAMSVRYLEAIPALDPNAAERYRRSVRDSLADDAELTAWFDQEAPCPPPAPLMRMRPTSLGFDGHALAIDTANLGVENVADAVRVAAALVGVCQDQIQWQKSSPDPLVVDAENRARAAEDACKRIRAQRNALRAKHRELVAQHKALRQQLSKHPATPLRRFSRRARTLAVRLKLIQRR